MATTNNFFGLDIGAQNIKAVELKKTSNGQLLQSYGFIPSPRGVSKSESIPDLEEIASAIKKLVKDSHITTNKVVVGLPESVVFTRVVEVPMMTDQELKTAMRWEAEQFIPIPLKDVKYDYVVVKRPERQEKDSKISVFFVAVPNTTIERYLKIMKFASLEAIAFETELIALSRALFPANVAMPTTLVINLGAETTDLSIVSKGQIAFTRSISSGGNALSKAIAQELGFEINQAEEYKKTYGLLEDQLEGKVAEIIRPIFDVIVGEVERGILFYQTHHPTDSVKQIVLCGGTAKLPGVVQYVAGVLDLEVQIGNPWNSVKSGTYNVNQQGDDGALYAVSVGLALRENS